MNKPHYGILSWLGPPLFLMYINDMTNRLKSNVKLLVDDIPFFSIVKNKNDGAKDLTYDLSLISKWDFNWNFFFDLEPTKYFFFYLLLENQQSFSAYFFKNHALKSIQFHLLT